MHLYVHHFSVLFYKTSLKQSVACTSLRIAIQIDSGVHMIMLELWCTFCHKLERCEPSTNECIRTRVRFTPYSDGANSNFRNNLSIFGNQHITCDDRYSTPFLLPTYPHTQLSIQGPIRTIALIA